MKKFFTLFCAIAIAFSASAAPIAPKAELAKKAPVAVEQMQKVQIEKAQFANFNQLSAAPALKVTNPKATTVRSNHMQKKAQAPARRSAVNARKAVNAPLNTNITIGTFSPATYEGEYYVTLTDANSSTQFYFDINTSVNPFQLGKTYTLNEMLADYVALGDANDWYAWEPATAATYKETVDEKGLTHIVASMTTESGTYDITYDQPEPQDINVTAVDWAYDDYYYDVYVYAENTTYLFELKESTGGLTYGTTYTYADMSANWVCTLDEEGYPLVKATDATLKVTKDEAGLIHIAATMVLSGNKHIIAYDEKAFEPSGVQINVNGTDLNGRYMSAYGFYLYTATWGDYTVQLPFNTTEEKATYTNDDFVAQYGVIYSADEKIQLVKLASDITITTTETTKTLTGSVYAKNGDEYILNLVYEKPAAKEININVKDANLTNKSVAGFWTIDGQTADKNNSFNIYFISKALQGTFTDVAKIDAYSTWVSDKSSGSNVYYENLSEVNLVSVIDGDSLKITGTMNLSDYNGNPAIVTVYITTPFTQVWGEWADFAPFDVNTGKYTLNAVFAGAVVTGVPVKERKDNTGLKQYQFLNLGKGYYGTDGINMTINMDANRICAIKPVMATVKTSATTTMNIILTDAYTATGAADYAEASYYDPETGTFNLFVVAFNETASQIITAANETMVMDKPILERDTVDVVSTKMTYNDFIATNQAVQFYAGSDAEGYTTFLVTSKNASTVEGTFDIYEGYCFADSTDGSRIGFEEGQITIVKEGDAHHLTGWVIGSNEKYYRLDWTEIVGVLNYDTDAPFEAEYQYTQMEAEIEDGVISIYATKEDGRTISLTLFADPTATEIPEGTYTISDSQEAATALQSVGVVSGKLTQCWAGIRTESGIADCWFMVEGTVTLSYDEYGKLKVVVDAKNSYGQPVTATVKYTKLDPKSTVAIDNATLSIYDGYFAQYGLLDFYGQNADGYGYDLYAYADTIIGDFLENIDFVDCGIITPNGKISIIDAYSFSVGGIGKALTLTASVLGSDTIQYNITATGYMGALPYDQTSDFEATFELDSAEVQAGAATTLTVTNDNNQLVALMFFAKAEGNKLPAGTYPINNTKTKNTVLASQGLTTSGPTYSFAAETNDQGQIAAPWWMVSGEVVVAEDGSITVNAVNSYDKTITINIVAAAPEVTDYYLVGWIDGAAYGIEGDIDNFGDYKFVDGKVTATFNEDSYVQVKDNNKQIYGTATYVNPVAEGTSAIVLATGTEKMGVYAGEYEFTLDIAEDGTMTLSYAPVATGLYRINANTAIRKALINGHVVIFKNNKAFNLMGAEL